MPKYRVIRIVHESRIIDAPTQEAAVEKMSDYGPQDVEAEVNDTYADPVTE